MASKEQRIAEAIVAISAVPKVEIDKNRLIDDAFLLTFAFGEEDEYLLAVANTLRALEQLVAGRVTTVDLKYQFAGWESYHFQHKVAQGQRADMRIVFKKTEEGVRVLSFGHRSLPSDFYERIATVMAE